MERITEAFVWPVRDTGWALKLVIIGLIALIPIIGWINGIGWMLASLDRLRSGDERLAAGNFTHIGRGARVFVAELIYGLVVVALGLIFYVPGILIAVNQSHGAGNPGLIALAILLNLAALGVVALGSLVYTFLLPAAILATDAGGIAAGLRIGAVVRRSRANPINTLIAGLMLIAASFVSSIGAIACGIGVIFTAPYALAMQAWIIRSFEIGTTGRQSE
ncbi:MAG: hypothetical protein AUH32_00800 [Actinobacteria bacterium 13_1_40CM_66_12]|nr:MAG: hypothetical protein AUH32_00800 [Actinobacteria bacterium 13_1_40CM_66_12]